MKLETMGNKKGVKRKLEVKSMDLKYIKQL